MVKTWITWEREGEPAARVELQPEVARTIEHYATEIAVSAADVVASLTCSFAAEVRIPDGDALATQLRGLLAQGPVMLTFRPQAVGVDVPEALRGHPVVTLRIGHGLTPPMTDLAIDAAGVRAVLHFSGQPYFCAVPWPAVLVATLENPAPAPAPPARERPKLRLV